MFPCLAFGNGYWWTAPIIVIAMMALCVLLMRGRAGPMRCGPDFGRSGRHREGASDRPLAQGEVNKPEYEEKKINAERA